MHHLITLLIMIFFISFAAALFSGFFCRKAAFKLDILDYPDERKIHQKPIPYLGGLSIYAGMWTGLIFILLFYPPSFLFRNEITAIIIGSGIACMFGIWDDVRGSGAIQKLLMQIIIGIIMYNYGFRIEKITLPFNVDNSVLMLGRYSILITIFWYALIMNAINLIDGLDGLAAGICAIVSLTIFMVSFDISASFLSLGLLAIITASALGFLYHNFHPAKIFMGDTGSLLLGFLIATATLISSTKTPAFLALIVPILALAIPIFDTGYAFIRRTLDGQHPFKADKRHLHHRLMALGLPHKNVVILIYYISIFIGLLAYVLSLASPGILIGAAVLIGLGLLLLVENLSFLERKNRARENKNNE